MKRSSVGLSILLLAGLILSACATPTAGPVATPETIVETVEVIRTQEVIVTQEVVVTQEVEVEVPAQRTEVRLSGWVANPQETALLESLLYKFSLDNPDIIVRYEPITGDYWQAMNTLVATGQEPDVYYMDIFQFPAFAANEVLVPLDDHMSASGVSRDDFIPSLIDAFTYNGETLGIPKDFNTLGMFYNRDLFEAANLDEPTDDWTWDDLSSAAEALSDPANNVYGFGVPPDAGRFPVFVFQNGGEIMSSDFSDTLLDSPEAVEAAEYYTSFREDQSGALPADVGEGWQGTVFGKGQFAMVYEGGWLIPYLRDQFPGVNYGVVHPPAGPGGEGNLIFTVAYVISPNSDNPHAAWRVIEFLTNEESQTTVLESGFALPSRLSLLESEYLAENPAAATIFSGSLEGARPFMWGLVGSDVNDHMSRALESIYLEDTPAADALETAAEGIREAIRQAQ
jgi:multiple sugar transport system substrate-binding protein